MAVCDPQSLINDASCFQCLLPGQMPLAQLALLVRILQQLDPTFVLNVNTLMDEAKCFECLKGGEIQLARLALLCRISQA